MIYPIITIGEDSDPEFNGSSFVGISKLADSENDISIVFPYGVTDIDKTVSDSDVEQKDQYAFLRRYVKVVQKALSTHKKEKLDSNAAGIHNPLAAVNLLHDYLSLGRYIEYNTVSELSERGKIDFNQTIKKVRPSVFGENLFFDQYITKKKTVVDNGFVAEVQCNIINHFMNHGGVVLFGQSISIPVRKIDLDNSKTQELTITRLRKELTNTFNSRKETIIRWSIAYIEGLRNLKEKEKEDGNWKYAIKASTLWEDMVDGVFSNLPERNKTQYGKTYEFTYIKGGTYKGDPTQHDTIYEDKELLIIIDAKMYGKTKGILSEQVLGKQFGYYEQAKIEKVKLEQNKIILNILVLPHLHTSNELYFQSKVVLDPHTSEHDDPYKIIFLYDYPTNELIDDYYYGRKKYPFLIDRFKQFIQRPDVASFLTRRGCHYNFADMPEVKYESFDSWMNQPLEDIPRPDEEG